jgi:hypothetical protein
MDLAILKAEIDNGLYRKPIEMLAKEFQYEPLPPETRMVIIAAGQRGGLLPAAAIARMVPELPNPTIDKSGNDRVTLPAKLVSA